MKLLLCLLLATAPPLPPIAKPRLYSPKGMEQAKSLVKVHKLSLGTTVLGFRYPKYDTNLFYHYDLEMSTNLVNWTVLRKGISGDQTVYTTNAPLGFFRIHGYL